MRKSSLFRVLGKMDDKERKLLHRFVLGPFQTPNNKSARLLEALEKRDLRSGLGPGEARQIFQEAYPTEPFTKALFSKRIAILNQLVRKFLVELEQQETPFGADLLLLRQYRKRRLDQDFSLLRKKLLKTIGQTPLESGERDRLTGLIEKEADLLFGSLQERRFDQSLQVRSDALDRFFMIQKLKLAVEMLNRQGIVEGEYHPEFVGEALRYLERELPVPYPEVTAYKMVYQLLQGQGDFEGLLHLLEEHQSTIAKEELLELYKYAQNHCIRQINQGNSSFLEPLNKLYRKQLDMQLLWQDGYMKVDDYKNITAVALQLKDFDWVYQFLHTYRPYLREEQRDSAFTYNLAYYYFQQGDFDQTIQLLHQHKYPDIYYEVSARFLLVRTYLRTEEYAALHYLIDSFRLRIMRDKVMAPHYRKGVLNFLIQLKKIARLQEDLDYLPKRDVEIKTKKIEQRIEKLEPLSNKKWLLRLLKEGIA
jgi:hypothetical protein